MKKINKNLLTMGTIATAFVPIVTAVACGNQNASELKIQAIDTYPAFSGQKISNHTLSAIVSDPENPRWQKAKEALQQNGTNVGFNTKTNIVKQSQEQLSWLSANPADAYIVGATDDTLASAWQNFDISTPVIAFDRLVKTNSRAAYNWYVTYDNSKVGFMQGAEILSAIYDHNFAAMTTEQIKNYVGQNKLDEERYIAAMGGDPADNNAGLFYNGALDLIKAVATVDNHIIVPQAFATFTNVANANWDYSAGQAKLTSALTALSDNKTKVAAVLAPNDGMATSAINALKATGLDPETVYITGQDANDSAIKSLYLESGQDMTISKPDTQSTAVAVALASGLLTHNSEWNVSDASAHYDEISTYIKAMFPSTEFEINGTEYQTGTNAPINTIKLVPKIITHDNLSQFFTVTE